MPFCNDFGPDVSDITILAMATLALHNAFHVNFKSLIGQPIFRCLLHPPPKGGFNPAPKGSGFFCAPGMGALLRVQVPPQVDHSERSEAQLHEGDRVWGGSVERSCEPMNKNRIEGAATQGERARNREALVIKAGWRRSGGCAAKECVLTRGDLALRLKGRRLMPQREVSRSRSSPSRGPLRPDQKGEGLNESE